MQIGIIHARKGSKRIKNKCLQLIDGKPMVQYSMEAAKESNLDAVYVTTDDYLIKEIGEKVGIEILDRPKELAEDVASEFVTIDAVHRVTHSRNVRPDVILTIQPTTPFMSPKDINRCLSKINTRTLVNASQRMYDTVITVKKVQERPEWMFRQKGHYLESGSPIKGNLGITQELPVLYIPNGAVFANTWNQIMEKGVIYGDKIGWVEMSLGRSLDIDENIDLQFARFLMERKEK